jgi:cell division septal protein FtsQ
MAKRSRLVSLADGRVVRLTRGEVAAMKRYVAMNGEAGSGPEGLQYDPGHVSYLTRRNLVAKGVLEMTGAGVPRFAKGVLSK